MSLLDSAELELLQLQRRNGSISDDDLEMLEHSEQHQKEFEGYLDQLHDEHYLENDDDDD